MEGRCCDRSSISSVTSVRCASGVPTDQRKDPGRTDMSISKSRPSGHDGPIGGCPPIPASRERAENHWYAQVSVGRSTRIEHMVCTVAFKSVKTTARTRHRNSRAEMGESNCMGLARPLNALTTACMTDRLHLMPNTISTISSGESTAPREPSKRHSFSYRQSGAFRSSTASSTASRACSSLSRTILATSLARTFLSPPYWTSWSCGCASGGTVYPNSIPRCWAP